jgi:hypothetical protein
VCRPANPMRVSGPITAFTSRRDAPRRYVLATSKHASNRSTQQVCAGAFSTFGGPASPGRSGASPQPPRAAVARNWRLALCAKRRCRLEGACALGLDDSPASRLALKRDPSFAMAKRASRASEHRRVLLVHLSSLGGPHRHARIHDEALVSGVRRRRRLTGHLLLTVTPPAPRL